MGDGRCATEALWLVYLEAMWKMARETDSIAASRASSKLSEASMNWK